MNTVVDEERWNCSQVDVELHFRQAVPEIAKAARIGAQGLINLLSCAEHCLFFASYFGESADSGSSKKKMPCR